MNLLLLKGGGKMPKIPDKNNFKNQFYQSQMKKMNFQKQSLN